MNVTAKAKLIRFTENPEGTIALASKLCYSSLEMDELIERIEGGDNAKFIRMLKSMTHLSPFEHASFTFAIEGVSRAFLAQVTRHRIASFSVRSQRYVAESDFNYIVPPAVSDLGSDAVEEFTEQMKTAAGWYAAWQKRLGGGEKANEDARFVLPNACETKMIMTMNARELMHFFELRCCNRAQWEIRDVAWQMLSQVLEVAPNVFENCGPACLTGTCPEGKKSCGKAEQVRERYLRLKQGIGALN